MTASGQRGHQPGRAWLVSGRAVLVSAAAAACAFALLVPPWTEAAMAGTSQAAAAGRSFAGAHPAGSRAAGPHLGRAVRLKLPLNAGPGTPIIESASCAQAGSCTLAGTYTDGSSVGQAMVVAESAGHWARAIELQLPANADPGIGGLAEAVSCSRVGSCVAAGNYRSNGQFEGFTAAKSHGVWHQARPVRLPSNAGPTGASIGGVSCTGPGSCALAGDYADAGGHLHAMAATESRGTWARARELRPPSSAGPTGRIFLLSIACTKAGSCVAVGTFDDKAGHTRAMVITESGGTWHQGIQLILPKDAAGVPLPSVPPMSVSCAGAGTCVAVSSYRNKSGRVVPMSIAESGGTWARGQHVTRAPANAAAVPNVTLTSVACTHAGTCTATGSYLLKAGGFAALIMTRSGTRWVTASQVRAPADAATGAGQIAQAKAIGCAAAGFCAVGGTYRTTVPDTAVMAASG